MPPKKKKGDKLSKMTEEERAIYLEQQRIAEEEMKAKKAAMLAQYLQDKLEREEKSTALNNYKLIHQWRVIMRKAKSEELRKDVEILSQTFERVIDRKESIIKTLVKDLNEAEEQHLLSLRCHLENVDRLIDLQNERLRKLKSEFESELAYLKEQFGQEEEHIIRLHNQQLSDLKDIFVALDSTYTAKNNEAKSEHHSIKDEIKNKNLEDKHVLRMSLEAKVNRLWSEFKTALNQYNTTTEEKKTFFENLKAKDEKSAAEIEMQMRKLQKISENIAITKRRMARVSKEYEEKNRHLKEEREKLMAHFQKSKTGINKLRESQHEKLIQMSLQSGAATKRVQHLLDKAEKIIKLAEHCRKYETEEEKVVPFYTSTLTQEEEKMVLENYRLDGDDEVAKLMRQCVPLEMFWRRFNKVQLDRLALNKEYSILEQENQQLKSLLKQYLDGITVTDQIITNQNSLLIVNNKSNVSYGDIFDDSRTEPTVKDQLVLVKSDQYTSLNDKVQTISH